MPTVDEVHAGLVDSELMNASEADDHIAAWRLASSEKGDENGDKLISSLDLVSLKKVDGEWKVTLNALEPSVKDKPKG